MTTYEWQLLDAGRLRLDGGGMFGLIPRVVWERSVEVDSKHRITVNHNCLLLRGGGRTVVIETGSGDKLDEKMTKIFDLDGKTVESALTDAGVAPESVDAVIVSHLHFDHAGGLTRRVRADETPDWTASEKHQRSGDAESVKLTFPNAEVIVQRREWEDALANDSVMTRTYYRDHLDPIADRVRLVDAPLPFERRPHRDELPTTTVDERAVEVQPGIEVFSTPGHTWGQQAVRFRDDEGWVVFTPDLMPTAEHVGMAYSLAYDVEPYTSMVTKHWFLREAVAQGWRLVLDHEPGDPVRRVVEDGRGWFALEPVS